MFNTKNNVVLEKECMLAATQAEHIAKHSKYTHLNVGSMKELRCLLNEIEVMALTGKTLYVFNSKMVDCAVLNSLRELGYKVNETHKEYNTRPSDKGFENVPCDPYKVYTITISWALPCDDQKKVE